MNIADVFSATQTGETSKRVFSSEKIPEITNIHTRMNLDCYLCNVKNANQMKWTTKSYPLVPKRPVKSKNLR